MNTLRFTLVMTALFIWMPATGYSQDKPRKTFLSALEEGQVVALKENNGRYEIRLVKDLQAGHRIIEIGPDYVVVEDAAKVTETRIPLYSIKAIIKLKVPKE